MLSGGSSREEAFPATHSSLKIGVAWSRNKASGSAAARLVHRLPYSVAPRFAPRRQCINTGDLVGAQDVSKRELPAPACGPVDPAAVTRLVGVINSLAVLELVEF